MRKKDYLDLMQDLDYDLIEEASYVKRKRKVGGGWIIPAASVCAVVLVAAALFSVLSGTGADNANTEQKMAGVDENSPKNKMAGNSVIPEETSTEDSTESLVNIQNVLVSEPRTEFVPELIRVADAAHEQAEPSIREEYLPVSEIERQRAEQEALEAQEEPAQEPQTVHGHGADASGWDPGMVLISESTEEIYYEWSEQPFMQTTMVFQCPICLQEFIEVITEE